jgi:hypothetical protein
MLEKRLHDGVSEWRWATLFLVFHGVGAFKSSNGARIEQIKES